jgi:beta-1,2-mannobiose phosphorylase / 1,2-beta-oligomannan phosphorylase
LLKRHPLNPLIRPSSISASREDFEVIGTFNAGVTQFGDETILLLRVAERPIKQDSKHLLCPYLDENSRLAMKVILVDSPNWDTSDPRTAKHISGEVYLTSISHLRLARSKDGVHFEVSKQAWLSPSSVYESFGIEDARITKIGERYYVNYTAVSPLGIATGLVTTENFQTFERHGIIFPPSNRDVAIFPEKIGNLYHCYHRPMPGGFGTYNIWAASSPDLIHWGNHRLVLSSQPNDWTAGRVGGGAPPVKTEAGWLSIYHAADRQDRYCLGAFLSALDDPTRIIAKSEKPIFEPEAPYETSGFYGNVVFSCGALVLGDMLRIYYGAADEVIALAEIPVQEVLNQLGQS